MCVCVFNLSGKGSTKIEGGMGRFIFLMLCIHFTEPGGLGGRGGGGIIKCKALNWIVVEIFRVLILLLTK